MKIVTTTLLSICLSSASAFAAKSFEGNWILIDPAVQKVSLQKVGHRKTDTLTYIMVDDKYLGDYHDRGDVGRTEVEMRCEAAVNQAKSEKTGVYIRIDKLRLDCLPANGFFEVRKQNIEVSR